MSTPLVPVIVNGGHTDAGAMLGDESVGENRPELATEWEVTRR